MKKIFILSIAFFAAVSCSDDLTSLNDDPKRATTAPAETLFSNAQKNLVDIVTTPSVNQNIFRLLSQQWTETTYTDESRYDLSTRNIPQNFWNAIYRDVLQDLREAKRTIDAADPTFSDPVVNKNQWNIAEILEVYAFSILINTFGDVPYNDALNDETVFPKYEDAKTIHYDLIDRLTTAVNSLDESAESYSSADLIYNGDIVQWKKFANSLKLWLGMMVADVDYTKSKTVVEEAIASGVFETMEDNAVLNYLETPPNTNPIWVNLVQSGRKDFVAANTIVDLMNELEDPRRELYFTTVDTIVYDAYEDGEPAEDATPLDTLTVFYGGTYGTSNSYSTYSKPAESITDQAFPASLLTYSDVEFLKAEAAERGMTVEGTAEEHYNEAIRASILEWGGTEDQADDYLAQPEVAYNTAEGDFRQKIGTQKWIALYNRGYEAWTEWRRLDYPVLQMPEDPIAPMPLRLSYPVNEQNLNTKNYDEAAAAMGGDVVTKRLFWDVSESMIE